MLEPDVNPGRPLSLHRRNGKSTRGAADLHGSRPWSGPELEAQRQRSALGEEGRVIVRWSGTEPKLRLMVEGPDETYIRGWARELVEAAERDVPPAV